MKQNPAHVVEGRWSNDMSSSESESPLHRVSSDPSQGVAERFFENVAPLYMQKMDV